MRSFAVLAALGLMTVPTLAAPTAAHKDEFYAVCMGIAQDQTLCSCKADAAMTASRTIRFSRRVERRALKRKTDPWSN